MTDRVETYKQGFEDGWQNTINSYRVMVNADYLDGVVNGWHYRGWQTENEIHQRHCTRIHPRDHRQKPHGTS